MAGELRSTGLLQAVSCHCRQSGVLCPNSFRPCGSHMTDFRLPVATHRVAAVAAIDQMVTSESLDSSKLLIWIDYTSIPQSNRTCQRVSIASLPVYTKFAAYFLMVVPKTSVGERSFSLESYQRRGWCRLEQWARLAQHSTEHMYVCDGGPPRDVSKDLNFLTQVRWRYAFIPAGHIRTVSPTCPS